MKRFYYIIFFFLIIPGLIYSQAPNISYQTPQVYSVNQSISPLRPTNTGGAVPPAIYGQVTTFAGSGATGSTNGTGTAASFRGPYNATIDAAGNIYVADCSNHLIRKVTTPGAVVTTLAGSGSPGFSNGTGTAASFNNPGGVTTDLLGNVYVGDQTNNVIRKITTAGVVTTFAGNGSIGASNGLAANASFWSPAGLVFDSGNNLYVADRNNNAIRKITPAGVVSTLAGNGVAGSANGTGTAATFKDPTGLAVDASDNIYVSDQDNNLIRKITPAGVVTTFAGSGAQGSTNGSALASSFNNMFSLSIAASGNLYVSDEFNQVIRQVTPAGAVTTLAGNGTASSVDGIGTGATLNFPIGVIPDGLGNLYVTETVGQKIRKIVINGYVIDKALPAGLFFDQTTGIISGTPTVASPATTYTITAYNNNGSSSTTVVIAITTIPQAVINYPPVTSVVYGSTNFTTTATSTNTITPIAYGSSNTSVATIDANGTVHIIGVGQTSMTASQVSNSSFSAATPVSQILIVTPATLNVAVNNQSKSYGSANPNFTFTYTGFVYNEGPSVITTAPHGTTTATLSSSVGVYPVTGSGATALNYVFTYTAGSLTITPIPLLITANNQTRIYGVVNPSLTVTYTGFVNGDDASKLAALPVVSTTAVLTSPLGQYPITASVAASPNYTITYAPGILNIIIAPRTLTFNPIPNKSTLDKDFDPGATIDTNDPITYTSSDLTIAEIVNGKIHILRTGTVTITASVATRVNYADVAPKSQPLFISLDDFVRIPPVVTPNGDNINDVLKIDGIASYPDNRFTLVNINGVKVYEIDGYDNVTNVFDGHSNITGVFQPKGTYFYSLQFNVHGEKQRRVGYVVLKY